MGVDFEGCAAGERKRSKKQGREGGKKGGPGGGEREESTPKSVSVALTGKSYLYSWRR